jgi:hypothetical protein
MAITTGTAVTVLDGPQLPGEKRPVMPVLQAGDGSFIGTVAAGGDETVTHMVAFEATGAVRWTVAGEYEPQIALDDGGVIATLEDGAATAFDQHGNRTGQFAGLPTRSWRGNTYQRGSVIRVPSILAEAATSLWANAGATPSGNSTAGRPWYFKLVWKNNCAGRPWPCGFFLYPDNPLAHIDRAINATSQATRIKAAALVAFKKAFSDYPVDADEGRPDSGDHRVDVIDGSSLGHPCGRSDNIPGRTISDVFYQAAMEWAQWNLPVVLVTAEDAQAALSRADLMKAIGAGIGNNAAHELAHQFLLSAYGMDDNSSNTYNGARCEDGAPWVYGIGPIAWGTATAAGLKNKLGAGHR